MIALLAALAGAPSSRADETFPVLTIGSEVYSNVTVTGVTATDIYFMYSGGMSNAKLKRLSPELQVHFHYAPAVAAAAEQQQQEAAARYRANLVAAKPTPPPAPTAPMRVQTVPVGGAGDADDLVAPKLNARSVRGQPAPSLVVAQWMTEQPDVNGKFVLVDFWATWCGPCRQSIPRLNAFAAKYKDRLVVIGISDESPEAVRKMTSPTIDYAVGVDPQARTSKELQIKGIPHCLLIDPHGIVRYEGHPGYLDDAAIEHVFAKYGG